MEKEYEPNYIKVKGGFLKDLFWDYFLYIDSLDLFADQYFIDSKVPVVFCNDLVKPDMPFTFVVVKCKKKYSHILQKEVFRKLHRKMTNVFGDRYTKFCEDCVTILVQDCDEKGIDIDEILSRPVAD